MKNKNTNFTETDMYAPVKAHFERLGYTMRAEVKGIDAAATLGDTLILFEFKKAFNMTLLYQALDRLKISKLVYLVIPKPPKRGGRFVQILHIASALGLGLITVDMTAGIPAAQRAAEIHLEPASAKTLNNKRTRAVIKEAAARRLDGNKAGSVNEKLLTAYREKSIHIVCMLYKHGELTPKQLRELGCAKDCAQVLRLNYYGWFFAPQKGLYFLTEEGFKQIEEAEFKKAVELYYTDDDGGAGL